MTNRLAQQNSDSDSLLLILFNGIGIIEQFSRNRFERFLPDGLEIAHFPVLDYFVEPGGEKSPAELARAFQVIKGAMTHTLQRLQTRDQVEARPTLPFSQ